MSGDKADKPAVAPGYPAVDVVRDIDVTGYEPAAVFHPIEPETVEESR